MIFNSYMRGSIISFILVSSFFLYALCVRVLAAGQIRKKGYFGKKGMHEERNNWKEEKHMCMQGRPKNIRVRVFVIHCNG
jgi:hypothetical protein